MVYRRRNADFNAELAQRADALNSGTGITTDARTGRVVILELPYLTFSTADDAARFLRRVLRSSRGSYAGN
jgi:hypothetical protein